jgi:sulfur carrier protein
MSELTITVNGEARVVAESELVRVLEELGYAGRSGIAVAVNDSVVPRSEWGETRLKSGDRIEIVVAVQGG